MPSFCSTSSAFAVRDSSSSNEVSGAENFTSSTLLNWCCRIMPRTSLPYVPASRLKHGVYAVYFTGRSPSARTSSRKMFVTGTSAVGTSRRSSEQTYMSSSNLGSWPVPVNEARLLRMGGNTSV